MQKPTSYSGKTTTFNPFSGPEIERVISTTKAQEEIWIACKLGGSNANRAYNESVSLKFQGALNEEAMEKACNTLISRHQSLRAVFSTDGRFMTVFKSTDIDFVHKDISSRSVEDQDKFIAHFIKDDVEIIFDLTKGPLIKFGLIKRSETEYQFVLTAHHIICDGWSIGIILQELGILYSAYTQGKDIEIPESESYSNYADEQQELIDSNAYKDIQKFWIEQFKDSIPVLHLPTDFEYPSLRNYKSDRLDLDLDKNLLALIKKVGITANCSLVTTLLAAFDIFLFKITEQNDIVVGLPTAGQSVSGKTQLVGHCVNLLPLRTQLNTQLSFIDYLKQRKSDLFDSYDHQQLSFGHLLQKLPISRNPSRVPMVPIVFNIDIGMDDGVSFHSLTYELSSNPRSYEIFEIFMNASGSETNLTFEWSYNTSIFKADTIKQMMASFENIMTTLISNPEKPLSHIFTRDYSEVYNTINATETDYPDKPLHVLIEEQALVTPTNIALEFDNEKTTYTALVEHINTFAYHFLNEGIKPGDFVSVSLPSGSELLYTLIAILKCGAAYIPLDPKYPQSRLAYMLEDSGAQFLITDANLSASFPQSIQHILIEDAVKAQNHANHSFSKIKVNADSMAYMLYTSGSTGKPKGVTITHKNLVNFLYSMMVKPGIKASDRLLSITTISFDIAGLELFTPLLKGATLVLTTNETARDGRLLLELLDQEHISILQATPTTWKMLLESGWDKPLPLKALCGGENLPLDLSKKLLKKCDSLWNMYGPTETTIWSSTKQILPEDELITIGKPIANTQLYILNDQKQLLPEGAIGEIAIGGDGVALGYWKREDLTSEKFISNPFGSKRNDIIYLTGDLGKLLPSGEIQCLGRLDQQIKIRGHRIELGEIEQSLNKLEGVSEAIVSANSDYLTAHILPHKNIVQNDDQINSWKTSLKKELPAHLIPSSFHFIDAIPKTLNGKLDRHALLKTAPTKSNKPAYNPPRTKTEQTIADIWKTCLELDNVDIFSNFFELGGHSLTAVKVMTLLEQETGKRLPLSALFEYSTVEKLAQLLNIDSQFITWDSLVPIKPEGNKTPLYIVHGAGLNVLIFNALAKNLDDNQPVYGLQAKGLNGIDEPLGTVEDIAAHYVDVICKSNTNGPYALAGYSFGGIIAYEMARQMLAKNKKITMIALLDTYVHPSYYYSSDILKKIASCAYSFQSGLFVLSKMLSSWQHTKMRFEIKKEKILNRISMMKYGKKEQHEILYKQPYALDKMNNRAMGKYHILPQDVVVDLFRVENDSYYLHDTITLGWDGIAKKGVHVHHIPGDHHQLFSPPNDKKSARILQDILDHRNEGV